MYDRPTVAEEPTETGAVVPASPGTVSTWPMANASGLLRPFSSASSAGVVVTPNVTDAATTAAPVASVRNDDLRRDRLCGR
jgi:hypothetical protein